MFPAGRELRAQPAEGAVRPLGLKPGIVVAWPELAHHKKIMLSGVPEFLPEVSVACRRAMKPLADTAGHACGGPVLRDQ